MYLEESFIKISDLIRNSNNLKLGSENLSENKSGDLVKQLDIISHNIIVDEIRNNKDILGYISEESDEITFFSNNGKYIIAFDPLDGSSNINCNVSVGSIYGIYLWNDEKKLKEIVEAGYCLYGPCTNLVRTEGNKVKMYQLDDNKKFIFIDELDLTNKNDKIYSFNESNYYNLYNNNLQKIIMDYKIKKYNLRWVGSMVADCHRTLIQGGIFMYPSLISNTSGKLRLAYESLPMAKIFETCGGCSWDGSKSLLKNEININDIHQKIPTFLGTYKEICKIKFN